MSAADSSVRVYREPLGEMTACEDCMNRLEDPQLIDLDSVDEELFCDFCSRPVLVPRQ